MRGITLKQGNGISRRALLGTGAGLAAATAVGTRLPGALGDADEAQAAGAVRKQSLLPPERIGLQLYSLRESVSDIGFAKVLETVAEIGFKHVEFAGYTQGSNPEITVKQLRALLDANGLIATGSHVSPNDDASMNRILDDAAVLGIPNVGVSLVTPNGATASGWRATAERYNHFGEMAAKRGVRFYFHNHFQEWAPVPDANGKRGIDLLLEGTNPALVDWQMDIYWAYVASSQNRNAFDPLADYALPQRNRIRLFHVKDGRPSQNQILDVGEGEIDFQRFFTELFKQSPDQVSKHIYLWERDSAADHPRGPLAAARSSYVNMRYGLFVPATDTTGTPGTPGTPGTSDFCAPAPGFTASIRSTTIRRVRLRRVLRVTLQLSAPAEVSARLVRGKRRLAGANRRLDPGTRTFDVPLPRSASAGAARLELTVSNGAGVSLALRDAIRVPRRRSRR
jgi:sugar phosphate isomerase/epimerase